ncbi:MAG: hypothetical protein OXG05_14905 [Gammaproteobacteria bacterium]|nr:hypothetical protein [Gammaproteobacteria bacterium]
MSKFNNSARKPRCVYRGIVGLDEEQPESKDPESTAVSTKSSFSWNENTVSSAAISLSRDIHNEDRSQIWLPWQLPMVNSNLRTGSVR